MRSSTRTAKSTMGACLVVLAGLLAGAGGELGAATYSTTLTGADDMPWGVVKSVDPAPAQQSGDMPWG